MVIIKVLKLVCTECNYEDEITDADDPELWDEWMEFDECPNCIKNKMDEVVEALE